MNFIIQVLETMFLKYLEGQEATHLKLYIK